MHSPASLLRNITLSFLNGVISEETFEILIKKESFNAFEKPKAKAEGCESSDNIFLNHQQTLLDASKERLTRYRQYPSSTLLTYDEWWHKGYQVKQGEKAWGYSNNIALFARIQVVIE